jgi:transposase
VGKFPIPERESTIELIKQNPEKFYEILCDLTKVVNSLIDRAEFLEKENAELKRRLNINSKNSSLPPSKDRHKPIKNLRKTTDRKPGGQIGHKGSTLLMVKNPTHTSIQERETCENCNHELANAKILKEHKRQVFDLPELPQLEVTEHISHSKLCPCCNHKNSPVFPSNVTNNTQYGENIESLILYFHDYQLLPYERVTEIFEELFGIKLSVGTILNTSEECFDALEEDEINTIVAVTSQEKINLDDTSVSVNGKLNHIFTYSSDNVSFLFPHISKGMVALTDCGILDNFKGTLIHDFYKPFFSYKGNHGSCNVHLLRELKYVSEEMNQNWSMAMTSLLCEIKEQREELLKIKIYSFNEPILKEYDERYMSIVKAAYLENPDWDKHRKKTKAANLFLRFDQYKTVILRFMYDFTIPFDNNLAERELRMSKLKMKISGCFRNFNSLKYFCRIRNYINNSQKKDIPVLKAIKSILEIKPMQPEW